jgi:hypothetical protein
MRRLPLTPPRPQPRAGTLFHYYLTYLFLISVLLTTTGLFLHTVLKSDRQDNQASAWLNTLLRMESGLRTDETDAVDMETTATELKFRLPEADSTVRWVALDHVLTRETNTAGKLMASDRFVFRKGTSLEFSLEDDASVRLTLTEPPRLGGPDTNSTAVAQKSRHVTILLMIPRAVQQHGSSQPAGANESESNTPADADSEGTN